MTTCLSPNGLNTYADATAPTRLVVATQRGVSILERSAAGSPWRSAGLGLEGKHISSLLFDEQAGGVFAGVHGGTLYFSGDEGRGWTAKNRGLDVDHVFSLASSHDNGRTTLYAGTEPVHLYRSTDSGETWHDLPGVRTVPDTDKWMFPGAPHLAHLKTLAVDSRDPQRMYAGVEQGALLLSTDGGQTWRELAGYSRPDDEVYKDIHIVNLRPSNPDEIYMTGGNGLYYSPDRGETWEHLSDRRARIGYPDQFQFSPVDDRVLFMAGAASNPGTWRQSHVADSTVMRSPDGGRTWREAGHGLPEHMRGNIEAMSLTSWPGGFELFAGTTDGEVYASADGADSWQLIASNLGAISKGGHYVPLQAAAA